MIIAATNAITDEMATDIGQIIEQPITAYEKIEQILEYYMGIIKDPQLRLAKYFDSFDLYEKIAEESPEQYAEYLSARSNLARVLLTISEQGKLDGSLRSEIDLDVFVMTMVQNFSIFTYKSSLTKHDSNLSKLLSADKQLLVMKDVFLRYIQP